MSSGFIFFLQITPALPNVYISLASRLKDAGIELVPVTILDLRNLMGNQKAAVLLINNSMLSNKNYRFLKKKHLDFMLLNRRIELIEISSFERPVEIRKAESQGIYHYLPLPDTINKIVINVKEILDGDKEEQLRWPGGRRTTLPPLS